VSAPSRKTFTKRATAKHNQQNNRSIEQLVQQKRDRRAEYQNQHERAFELPNQQFERTQLATVLHHIRTVLLKSCRGLRLRQASRPGAERRHERGLVQRPKRAAAVRRRCRSMLA
jgi:hypothetical protein